MSTIIFDFDGTIADSFDYVADFLAHEAGINQLTEYQRDELRHMSMRGMVRHLQYPAWKLPVLYFKGRRVMSRHIKNIEPFEGIPEVIRKLHAEGHELFIVTSNSLRNVHEFLHHNDLHTYFLKVVASVSVFGKAGALRSLLEEQKLSIEGSVYIGDELRDIQAAESIKLKVIAVTWGFARVVDLEAAKPLAMISNPADLIKTLEEL